MIHLKKGYALNLPVGLRILPMKPPTSGMSKLVNQIYFLFRNLQKNEKIFACNK
jgi:hypothetical protein